MNLRVGTRQCLPIGKHCRHTLANRRPRPASHRLRDNSPAFLIAKKLSSPYAVLPELVAASYVRVEPGGRRDARRRQLGSFRLPIEAREILLSVRAEFSKWLAEYPRDPGYQDGTFKGASIATFIQSEIPRAVEQSLPPPCRDRYNVEASAGAGGWAHVPWVALLDPTVTTSVQEGIYIIYLLSLGCERLYLTLNQGCTTLKKTVGIEHARRELIRRSETMLNRIEDRTNRLRPIAMDLNVERQTWRGKLYEAGLVVGACYDTANLPSEDDLVLDLLEALSVYHRLNSLGGWDADDDILGVASQDGVEMTLEQSKRNRPINDPAARIGLRRSSPAAWHIEGSGPSTRRAAS